MNLSEREANFITMNELTKKFYNYLYDLAVRNNLLKEREFNSREEKINEIRVYLNKLQKLSDYYKDRPILTMYYQKRYVIKSTNIPSNYYENSFTLMNSMATKLTNQELETETIKVIKNAQNSLEQWLAYFNQKDYPYFFKFWAFQGLIKLGTYNKDTKSFRRRTLSTIAPFIEIQPDLIEKIFDLLVKYLNGNNLGSLTSLFASYNFPKIFTYFYCEKEYLANQNINQKGKWFYYPQHGDYQLLANSLKGYNTCWCTTNLETAKKQLEVSEFYIYYTLDEENNYTIPRIAIRVQNNKIQEIRGIQDSNQNVEPCLQEVLATKIKDFSNAAVYLSKLNDNIIITTIYEKFLSGKELNDQELSCLYEIDYQIKYFGYGIDPRLSLMIKKRNITIDLAKIFSLSPLNVATNLNNINADTLCYYGLLKKEITSLMFVVGSLYLEANANYPHLIRVTNYLNGNSLKDNALSIPNLKYIGSAAHFYNLKSSQGLENLEIIGGMAAFANLEDARGLGNLKYIGNDADFNNLTSLEDLKSLKFIGGNLIMQSITNTENLEQIVIQGDLICNYLPTDEVLSKLQIGGQVYCRQPYEQVNLTLKRTKSVK